MAQIRMTKKIVNLIQYTIQMLPKFIFSVK
jgi:hypothetical protein